MKKRILIITILSLVVCFAFAFANPVMAESDEEQQAYEDVTIECIVEPEGPCCKGVNDENCCENTCKTAWEEYACAGCCYSVEGNVIKLTNDIAGIKVSGGNYTIDLNGHTIKSVKNETNKILKPVYITGGNATIINTSSTGAIETGTAVDLMGKNVRIYYRYIGRYSYFR